MTGRKPEGHARSDMCEFQLLNHAVTEERVIILKKKSTHHYSVDIGRSHATSETSKIKI
jgi:hypothetical protein